MITIWFATSIAIATLVWCGYRSQHDIAFVITLLVAVGLIFASRCYYVLPDAFENIPFQASVNRSFAIALSLFTIVAGCCRNYRIRQRWFTLWTTALAIQLGLIPMLCYLPIYQAHLDKLEDSRLRSQKSVQEWEDKFEDDDGVPEKNSFLLRSLAPQLAYEAEYNNTQLPLTWKKEYDERRLSLLEQELSEAEDAELDTSLTEGKQKSSQAQFLSGMLAEMHTGFVDQFIERSGFGIERGMLDDIKRRILTLPDAELIPQPHSDEPIFPPSSSPDESSEELFTASTVDAELLNQTRLESLNRSSLLSFASNSTRTPIVSLTEVVYPFRRHAFTIPPIKLNTPENTVQWKLLRLELVSILKHHPAKAYVSEHLPAMSELVEVPTRELDQFEKAALKQFRTGEDIVADRQRNEMQMLGSIRATQKCIECHSVMRGALLGAFTYRFRREPLLPEPANDTIAR